MPLSKAKSLVGTVVSDQMMKTVVVAVQVEKHHPIYKKLMRRTKRYKAHDGDDRAKLGDVVKIVECRPFSREKRWRVVEVLSRTQTGAGGEGSDSAL